MSRDHLGDSERVFAEKLDRIVEALERIASTLEDLAIKDLLPPTD